MEGRIAHEFALSDEESLALTLAKLALMETDLEGDPDHADRMVKRAVVRRYNELVTQHLGVDASKHGGTELDWAAARERAAELARRVDCTELPSILQEELEGLGSDARRYLLTSPDIALCALEAITQRRRGLILMIELAAFHPWPEGTKWERKVRALGLTRLVRGIGAPVDQELMSEIDKKLGAAVRRLSRTEVNKRKIALIALGGAAAGVLTGGLAAPLIGSAVGGAMGLSGAAATSAGLALLGGGAIAAGGFGMAGGTVLVAGAAAVSGAGVSATGAWLKGARTSDVVVESAKLEVLFEYLLIRDERSDELQRLVVERLQEQIAVLIDEINELSAIVAEQHHVQSEHDELGERLTEEQEKREVLERSLGELQRMRQEQPDG